MDELNLPDRFRELEKATKNWGFYEQYFKPDEAIGRVLKALSDSMNELHIKDCIIGDLVKEKADALNEIKRLEKSHLDFVVTLEEKFSNIEKNLDNIEDMQNFIRIQNKKKR